MNPTRSTPRVLALCFLTLSTLAACKPKADGVATDTATAPAPDPIPAAPTKLAVTEYGYGPLRAGMTFTVANDSLKGALKADPKANLAECEYVKWEGGPAGLLVMVLENKIARIDINAAGITTEAGAGVGDTEERIKTLYGNRVSVSPHKYDDGNYLTVKSTNPADTMNLIIFEAVKGTVTRYRAGLMPGVGFIEGCS